MTRAEKAERIQKILAKLYPLPPIPLQHEDPYTLLLAVVLSAQCTDVRVNLVTPSLFARARTPDAMARLAARDIQTIIQTGGQAPAKARHIRELSRILVERHGGVVPVDFEALEALAGASPHDLMIVWMSRAASRAMASGVRARAKRRGVTWFTRTSVHWADRTTARSSVYGSSCCSGMGGSG
jgi:endonuclease-3